VKRPAAWCALAALGCVAAIAGDWLSLGGDPQHSGWQKRGKLLTTASVKDLKLLWKRQLDTGPLTAPVIVGPTITHRGVRELVFVGGGRNDLYAVDADLGTLFWKRHFDGDAATPPPVCGSGAMATPVIEPDPNEARRADDEPGRMRPVYAVAGDGRLHQVRPSDGVDMTEPVPFLKPNTAASSLNLFSKAVYAATVAGCGGALANTSGVVETDSEGGVSIGSQGTVYYATGDKIVGLRLQASQPRRLFAANGLVSLSPTIFEWQGREWIVEGTGKGLAILGAMNLARVAGYEGDGFTGRAATWQDTAGLRWIYAATGDSICAFKIVGTAEQPKVELAWRSDVMNSPGSPVGANGIVFTLAGGPHATLIALDATTGKALYSSGDAVKAAAHSRDLAVANGHVCFVTTDNVLNCFGIPIE
jgi:outer membrane protein assembly factor BamB